VNTSTSMVIFIWDTPFRRLDRCNSQYQDSRERTFGLSKAEGAFLVLFVNARHNPGPNQVPAPISGRTLQRPHEQAPAWSFTAG
jgi:hypothetical protein